jgi:hypothetical protein
MSHPLQPIFDIVAEINCTLKKLLAAQTGDDPNVIRTVKTIEEPTTRLVDAQILVRNTSTLIVSANSERRSIIILNRGVDNLFIGMNSNIDIGTPISIRQNETWNSDSYRGQVYGISDGGSLDVRVQQELV